MATTVLVVDDHPGFRASARRMLEDAGYEVVGEAPDGAGAVRCARDLHPQLALVDIHLPDFDGFEVATRLAALDRAPQVVLTSSHDGDEIEALLAGSTARGFVPKAELTKEAIEELIG